MFVGIILLILTSGFLLGFAGKSIPPVEESWVFGLIGQYSVNAIEYVLIFFVFLIGLDMGLMESRMDKIRRSWKVGALIYLGTVSGSLFAGLLLHLLTDYSIVLTLSVAAGMGWYSLTGPFLAKTLGTIAGALGFTSNFLRELLTIVLYPKIPDKKSAISIGGATTMDTALPIITKFSDSETGLIAFIHGFFISITVPVLLTAISSIG
jgi:uncharacterized membrane protein YbjE (DUF340 family)